ncbi:MAG: hypothetical protein AB1705_09470 [Verrucomicrobiota bacterium]
MSKFSCTKCNQHIAFDDKDAGREIECPKCKTKLTLPGTPAIPAVAPATPAPAAAAPATPAPARKPFSPVTIVYVTMVLVAAAVLGAILLFQKREEARGKLQREQINRSIEAKAAAKGPPAPAGKSFVVTGTLPAELAPDAVESIEATFYQLTSPANDVGEVRGKTAVTLKGNSFEAGFAPPTGGSYRAEVLVRSKDFAPLMGRAMLTNHTVTAEFVPLLARTNAVRIQGYCVDVADGKPVPWVGIYLDHNKTLTARANEKGEFECFIPAKNGRASFVAWLRTHVGRNWSVPAGTGEVRELQVTMKRAK